MHVLILMWPQGFQKESLSRKGRHDCATARADPNDSCRTGNLVENAVSLAHLLFLFCIFD